MRLPAPRIAPLGDAELSAEAREVLASLPEYARGFNIFRTQAHNPDALAAFLAWGNFVLSERNSLTPRQRELAILRTGWNCKAAYEWAQHVVIGLRSGIAESEIAAIKTGPGSSDWNPLESAILRACDELTANHHITDATWEALAPLGDTGRVDLIYTVGQYTQVSMLLNACGVQLDPGLPRDPELG